VISAAWPDCTGIGGAAPEGFHPSIMKNQSFTFGAAHAFIAGGGWKKLS
jgi:hypothetical protein